MMCPCRSCDYIRYVHLLHQLRVCRRVSLCRHGVAIPPRCLVSTDSERRMVGNVLVSDKAASRRDRPHLSPTSEHAKSSLVTSFARLASKWGPLQLNAITKAVSSLNLDLPHGALQHVITRLGWRRRTDHDLHRGSTPERHRKEVMMLKQPEREEDARKIKREEHDFTRAMSDTEQSIRNYFDKCTPAAGDSKALEHVTSVGTGRTQPAADVQTKEPLAEKQSKRQMIAIGSIERRTRELVNLLKVSTTVVSQRIRLEDLCHHLLRYPDSRGIAVKMGVVRVLLKMRASTDRSVQQESLQALVLAGHVNNLHGRGVRILAIDGGGTRGLLVVELLKQLEKVCGQPIHLMFDYICGVSTGALLMVMLGAYRVPIDEIEQIYREFSGEMFERSRLMGASKLFTTHAYYDTGLWEKILQKNLGDKTFMDSAKDPECPKLTAVSALMNLEKIQCYLFRNYNLPAGVQSHYMGSGDHQFWEAIRASSAAPGYYEECKLGGHIHQDGGVLTNNPTAIAIHECRLLWPAESLQCVVSLGTGRYEPTGKLIPAVSYTSLKSKVVKIVQSATDTEAVHTVLHDLLPPSSYFRFNPYMSEDFQLDEVRTDKWDQMVRDTQMYCRKNQAKLEMAAQQLQLRRLPHQRVADWTRAMTA